MNSDFVPIEGGCACEHVRYRMNAEPMTVHCCHCTFCQTQTGSAFALNALNETSNIELVKGNLEKVETSSPSGHGQIISRCPKCKVALWSSYMISDFKEHVVYLRVGTLDDPSSTPPQVHIYTSEKQDWVLIPSDAATYEEFYPLEEVLTQESLQRRTAVLAQMAK